MLRRDGEARRTHYVRQLRDYGKWGKVGIGDPVAIAMSVKGHRLIRSAIRSRVRERPLKGGVFKGSAGLVRSERVRLAAAGRTRYTRLRTCSRVLMRASPHVSGASRVLPQVERDVSSCDVTPHKSGPFKP